MNLNNIHQNNIVPQALVERAVKDYVDSLNPSYYGKVQKSWIYIIVLTIAALLLSQVSWWLVIVVGIVLLSLREWLLYHSWTYECSQCEGRGEWVPEQYVIVHKGEEDVVLEGVPRNDYWVITRVFNDGVADLIDRYKQEADHLVEA